MSDSTSTSTNYYSDGIARSYYFSGPVVSEDLRRIWVSHETGRQTLIRDMQDDHLMSAISMIKRGYDYTGRAINPDYNIKLPLLEQEARARGLIPQNDGWDL